MTSRKIYLLTYNLLLFIGWSAFFIRELLNGFAMDEVSLLLLNVVQGAAVLEIVHAALQWVKTPVTTTFIQVASRIFVLIFINILPPESLINFKGVTGVMLVTIAWGVTEMIRYSFYFFSLLEKEIYALTWMRYSFFIVLYPIGVVGEWLILLSVVNEQGWEISFLNVLIAAALFSYIPFFPKLYLYMWSQRKKKLR